MTRLEAQSKLSSVLMNNGLIFKDVLEKTYVLSSYENLMSFIKTGLNAYSGRIKEYETVYNELNNNLNLVIDRIMADDNCDILATIRTTFQINIYGGGVVILQCIVPGSLSDEPGRNLSTIYQIYFEHGTEVLGYYVELINNPRYMSSYLNEGGNKQIAAMEYLLFSTGHHSSNKFRRDLTSKKFMDDFQGNYKSILDDLTNKKEEYNFFIDQKKNEYESWFSEKTKELQGFFDDTRNKREDLEETYSAKLKIEKPAKFMKDQSKKYKRSFIGWSVATVILSVFVITLLAVIISPSIEFNENIIELHLFSKELPVYSSMIIIAIISLIVYVIRIFIKVALSSKHISEEYKQKHVLTYFYLSLLNDGKINDEVEKYILASLFSKTDTGLIKGDGGSDNLLINMIEKSAK